MIRKRSAILLVLMLIVAILVTSCTSKSVSTPNDSNETQTTDSTESNSSQTSDNSDSANATDDKYYNPPGTLPIVKEPITLKVLSPTHAGTEDYNTNKLMKYIEEKTNINIDVITYPEGEFLTKLDLLVAAGGDELGDVIAMTGTTHLEPAVYNAYGRAGFLLDVSEYLDTLAYYMPAAYEATKIKTYESAIADVRSSTGEVYGLPNEYSGVTGGDNRDFIQIYKPWLEAAGMELPTSLAELRAYLEYVRDHDMDGDGNLKNEIPLTSYPASTTNINLLAVFVTPFMGVTGNIEYYIDKETDTIAFTYDKDGYREALRYMRDLVKDGLLDPNSFTQDKKSHDALVNLDPNIVGAYARYTSAIKDAKRRNDWVVTTSLANDKGVRKNATQKDNAAARWFITTKCEYPEAAFLLGDYLCSPEILVTSWRGWEGEDWVWVKDYKGDISNLMSRSGRDVKECYIRDLIDYGAVNNVRLTGWGGSITGGPDNPIMGEEAIDKTAPDIDYTLSTYEATKVGTTNNTRDTTISLLNFTPEEEEILSDCWTPIKSYVEECYARFCLGDMSIEDDWDSYLQTLESMGLSKVVEVWNACYSRMKSN